VTWVRFEENFHLHPKVASLSDRAFRVWASAISYCNALLTDGQIPAAIVSQLGATSKVRGELLASGLWEDDAHGGAIVHDYLAYQPSRAKVQESRNSARERMRNTRQQDCSREHHANDTRTSVELPAKLNGSSSSPIRSDPEEFSPPIVPPSGGYVQKVAKKPHRKRPRTERPADWRPSAEHARFCLENRLNLPNQQRDFENHHDAHGNVFADWSKAFWTWLHKSVEFGNGRQKPPGQLEHEARRPETRPARERTPSDLKPAEMAALAQQALQAIGGKP
jgi:hypothetical protein